LEVLMMKHRALAPLLFILMLGVSSESYAFLEWLHRLSGPGPFVGLGLGARFTCERSEGVDCRFVEWTTGPSLVDTPPRWTWSASVSGAASYENGLEYDAGVTKPRVWIWSIEPAMQLWITERRDVFLGVGWAFTEFQGSGFEDFRRDAAILRAGKRFVMGDGCIRALEVGIKYQYFEEEFLPSDFGARGEEEESRGVLGLFGTLHFRKQKQSSDDGSGKDP
jgi:hypothetical protein